MATILCIKDFSLKVNPDPTFQGLIWTISAVVEHGSGGHSFTGLKDKFSLHSFSPTNPGDSIGTLSTSGILPTSAKTRSCVFHIDRVVTGGVGNASQGYPNTGIAVSLGGVNIPSQPAFGWEYGSGTNDLAFTIPPGGTNAQRTLAVIMRPQTIVISGNPVDVSWTGYLYVATYS